MKIFTRYINSLDLIKKSKNMNKIVLFKKKAPYVFILFRLFAYLINKVKRNTFFVSKFHLIFGQFNAALLNKNFFFIELLNKENERISVLLKKYGLIYDYFIIKVQDIVEQTGNSLNLINKNFNFNLNYILKQKKFISRKRLLINKKLLVIFFQNLIFGNNYKFFFTIFHKYVASLTVKKLKRFAKYNKLTLLVLNSNFGLITHLEAYKLRIGGRLYCKII